MDPAVHSGVQIGPPPTLVPSVLGGGFIGLLSALPLVNVANCCCLWLVTGGLIAAWLQQQNYPRSITLGSGALVGFLAGVLGAFAFVLVSWPIDALLGPMMTIWTERLMESARDVPPDMRGVLERFSGRGIGLAIGFVYNLGLGMIFSTLGGLLGAVLFRRPPPADSDLPPFSFSPGAAPPAV